MARVGPQRHRGEKKKKKKASLSNEKGMMSYLYKHGAPKNTSHINPAPRSKSNTLH